FTQNVVTYTVVIAVDNMDGALLPYLTARVQFEAQRRSGVLLVPNAALRWKPPSHLAADRAGAAEASRRSMAWVSQGDHVRPVAVIAGLTDGIHTEVQTVEAGGGALKEGTEIVLGLSQSESDESLAGNTPFLPKVDAGPGARK